VGALLPAQELATAKREAAGRAGPQGGRLFAEGYPEFRANQAQDENGRISMAGFVAAGHRAGGRLVREYINLLAANDWNSHLARTSENWSDKYDMIETRLRQFSVSTFKK